LLNRSPESAAQIAVIVTAALIAAKQQPLQQQAEQVAAL